MSYVCWLRRVCHHHVTHHARVCVRCYGILWAGWVCMLRVACHLPCETGRGLSVVAY